MSTFLILHIIIALSGVIYTTYLLIAPSQNKFRISYSLLAGTLATGFYLTIMSPAHILQTCMTGLLYTGLILSGILVAHRRLATETKHLDQ